MLSIAIAFLSGNVLLHQMPELPGLAYSVVIPALALLFVDRPWARFVGALVLGFCWTWLAAFIRLDGMSGFDGGDFTLSLRISSIPIYKKGVTRFQAEVIDRSDARKLPDKLFLRIYGDAFELSINETIRADVRLKPLHSYSNPGTFDYGKLLFSRGIGATGYIRQWSRLKAPTSYLKVLRHTIYKNLLRLAAERSSFGSVLALSIGEKGHIDNEQRQLLAATGVGHLFAISGLHITLIFGIFYGINGWLWRRFFLQHYCLPVQPVAALAAFPWALAYAWLAGFSTPTQRALIMLGCVVLGMLATHRVALGRALSAALVIILLLDPFSSLSASFWLSFLAVAAIGVYLHESFVMPAKRHWLGLHLYIPVAVLPAGLWFFGQGSLIAPLANLVAIPYLSFLVLPLVLLVALFSLVNAAISGWLFEAVDFLFEGFWQTAAWLYTIPAAQWFHKPPLWTYFIAIPGIVALAVVTGIRRKLTAFILILPLAVSPAPTVAKGDFEAAFLDVGQGLAVVIMTRRHALLFDAGPSYSSGFNLGQAVVLPYLRGKNIRALDAVVLSHLDSDHAGGMEAVLEYFDSGKRWLGGGKMLAAYTPCQDGISWEWDGVRFTFLHPDPTLYFVGNDASCVLKIDNRRHSLLLSGDIEISGEKVLLEKYGEKNGGKGLHASAMLVPHHGSLTSSSEAFLQAVNPKIAVVSSGFRNRFALPKQEIVQRYLDKCVRFYNTADSGAVTLRFPQTGRIQVSRWRVAAKRYWQKKAAGSYALSQELCGNDKTEG